MPGEVWAGARPKAWVYCSLLWSLGAGMGSVGYFDKLWESRTLPVLRTTEGGLILLFSVFITTFLSIAYIWASNRQGRPLSAASLLLYPLCNALGEGCLLLFVFDLGRWVRPWAAGKGIAWQQFTSALGSSALETKGLSHELFFLDFMWGFCPYTLLHAVLHAYLYEEHILPEHLSLEAPNTFMKSIVVAQFSYVAIYYATGDVFASMLMRWVYEVLVVLAVRMPPPGAGAGEAAAKKKKAS